MNKNFDIELAAAGTLVEFLRVAMADGRSVSVDRCCWDAEAAAVVAAVPGWRVWGGDEDSWFLVCRVPDTAPEMTPEQEARWDAFVPAPQATADIDPRGFWGGNRLPKVTVGNH
jgi:hypothetical protein